MAIFVNSGGDTFKYKEIVENSVENHGLGWIVPGNAIIAETSISTSDWEDPVSKANYGVDVTLSYISNSNRITDGTTYLMTCTGTSSEGLRTVETFEVLGTAEANGTSIIATFYPPNTTLKLIDDGTTLKLNAPNAINITVKVDEAPTYNKIDDKFFDSAYIVTYDYSTEEGDRTFSEILQAFNEGKNVILKAVMQQGALYLPLTQYINMSNTEFLIFSGFVMNSTYSMTIEVFEDSGVTVYDIPEPTTLATYSQVSSLIPSQTGNSGKFLTTNGSTLSWGTVDIPQDYVIFNESSSYDSVNSELGSGKQLLFDSGNIDVITGYGVDSEGSIYLSYISTQVIWGPEDEELASKDYELYVQYHKVDTSDNWTTEINSDKFAHLLSPNFTGIPTAPTAASGTNTTQIATTAFVQTGLATKQKTITVSTNEPTSSDGVDGDIWFVYEE